MNELHKKLAERYLEILGKKEYESLIRQIADKENQLSNIHLGFVPDNYEIAKNKILVVGRETRSWLNHLSFDKYDWDGVQYSINSSKSWVSENLTGKYKNGVRGKTFFNFVRKVAAHSGHEGILWANIFSVAYRRGNPKSHIEFQTIKNLSEELLKAQIEILNPNIILFVSGDAGVMARREYFPNLKGSCEKIDQLPLKYLERFYFEGQESPVVYRALHPSTRSKNGQQGLQKMLHLLPAKD